jgi:adenylate cyclase
MAPAFLAQVLWLQGFADRALGLAKGSLAEAEERQYGAFAVTTNLFFLCWVLGWRRDFAALSEQTERIRGLANKHEFYESVSQGGLLADWPRLASGDGEGRAALARRRLESVRRLGGMMLPFKLGLLAEALAQEDADEALEVIDEALSITRQGERWSEAELVRIKGSALLARDPTAAEECFRASLATAREQGARAWELRAATALARLWLAEGKPGEARALLSPVYLGFTEAHDTADLRDAKTLLDGL